MSLIPLSSSVLPEHIGLTREQVNSAREPSPGDEFADEPSYGEEQGLKTLALIKNRPLEVGQTESDWREDALCANISPADQSPFFPPETKENQSSKRIRVAKAIAMCQNCPVKKECLEYAINAHKGKPYGIWGGVLFDD